jgi:hypothetical protein
LACNKPDASFGDHTGAYTKKVQTVKALVRVGGSQSGVQVK